MISKKDKIRQSLAMCDISLPKSAKGEASLRHLTTYRLPVSYLAKLGLAKNHSGGDVAKTFTITISTSSSDKPRNELFIYGGKSSLATKKDGYMFPLTLSHEGMGSLRQELLLDHEFHGGSARIKIAGGTRQGAGAAAGAVSASPLAFNPKVHRHKGCPPIPQPELGC